MLMLKLRAPNCGAVLLNLPSFRNRAYFIQISNSAAFTLTGTEKNDELLKCLMKAEVIGKTKAEMDRFSWYDTGDELFSLECTFGSAS